MLDIDSESVTASCSWTLLGLNSTSHAIMSTGIYDNIQSTLMLAH